MRKSLFIAVPLIIVAAAVYLPGCNTGPAQKAQPDKSHGGKDTGGSSDSPIIVGDGSVHVRQHDGLIHLLSNDMNHAYVNLDGHVAVKVTDGACRNPNAAWASCNPGSSTALKAPWRIEFFDSANANQAVGSLTAADEYFPAFVIFATAGSASTLTPIADNVSGGTPGDGAGVAACSQGGAHCTGLGSARLMLNNGAAANIPLCQNLGGRHCIVKISYCKQDIAADPNQCK